MEITMLNQSLERIKPYLIECVSRVSTKDINFTYKSEEDYDYFSSKPTKGEVARLRLDWELATPMPSGQNLPPEDVVHLMTWQMRDDLVDLLINGDVSNATDPLLKTIDGSKKRGKAAEHIDIFAAHLFVEPKPRKKTTEYTLYILMNVDFGDDS